MSYDSKTLIQRDQEHLWHPYSSVVNAPPVYPVVSADKACLTLADGRQLVDGMASWWCAIHGYNHPVLNEAVSTQMQSFSHVMFGGLTHEPAIRLAETLVTITPKPLETVFFADSGSVSVEVAIKMALQYWITKSRPDKYKLLTVRGGYHGDTFSAMSVCDPVTGMHSRFKEVLAQQYFAPRPECRFNDEWFDEDIQDFKNLLESHHDSIAAVILEPIVQGAGGMWFYSSEYLKRVRQLCDEYDVLLILDEIATGFGRTGRLFACEYADVSPDIMCLGKSLTGGYMTLAATITTKDVAETISDNGEGMLMHGPTFMANPLACSVAQASIDLLLEQDWQTRITEIGLQMTRGLEPCKEFDNVVDVRVLGAIGVVEINQPVNMHTISAAFVEKGVWVRPFARLIYIMPPYIIENDQLEKLTSVIKQVVEGLT